MGRGKNATCIRRCDDSDRQLNIVYFLRTTMRLGLQSVWYILQCITVNIQYSIQLNSSQL